MMAGHWLCGRAARRELPALGYMAAVYALTSAFLACIAPFAGGVRVTAASLPGIAVLALVCTLGGHALMTFLLGYVSADVVSFALLGEPVGAALWALALFGERVTAPVLTGGLTIVAGLALYTAGEMRAARRDEARRDAVQKKE